MSSSRRSLWRSGNPVSDATDGSPPSHFYTVFLLSGQEINFHFACKRVFVISSINSRFLIQAALFCQYPDCFVLNNLWRRGQAHAPSNVGIFMWNYYTKNKITNRPSNKQPTVREEFLRLTQFTRWKCANNERSRRGSSAISKLLKVSIFLWFF